MISVQKTMLVDNEHLYGPGERLLIYLKGCSIHCEGCINPHLWSFEGGEKKETNEIVNLVFEKNLDGVTLHGGEPLDQANGLLDIVRELKRNDKTVILFTGYTKKELNRTQIKIWNLADIVIAGRFKFEKRNIYLQFRGSTNQRVYFHKGKYKTYKLNDGFSSIILTTNEDGTTDINGFLSDEIMELAGELKFT